MTGPAPFESGAVTSGLRAESNHFFRGQLVVPTRDGQIALQLDKHEIAEVFKRSPARTGLPRDKADAPSGTPSPIIEVLVIVSILHNSLHLLKRNWSWAAP